MTKAKNEYGITLSALVVTIIVLLILARHKYWYVNRTEWNFEQSSGSKRKDRNSQ